MDGPVYGLGVVPVVCVNSRVVAEPVDHPLTGQSDTSMDMVLGDRGGGSGGGWGGEGIGGRSGGIGGG